MTTEAPQTLIYRDYFDGQVTDVLKGELVPARDIALNTDVIIFPRGSRWARPYHARIVEKVATRQPNNPLIDIGRFNYIGGGTLVRPLS